MLLVAQAFSRGNSKTEGFKSRIVPVGGKISRALSLDREREKLHQLARRQIEEIEKFDVALRRALALIAAGGDAEKRRKEHFAYAKDASAAIDRAADEIFFEHLWARFEAQENSSDTQQAERLCFIKELHARAKTIFEASLPAVPCASLFRPRAEARARQFYNRTIRKSFPELFLTPVPEEPNDVHA